MCAAFRIPRVISPAVRPLPPRVALRRCPPRPLRSSSDSEGPKEEPVDETSLRGLFYGGLYEQGKDSRLFGDDVDPDVPLPPEYEQDFWENPSFDFVGTAMQYFIPVLIVLALVVGGIAAKAFNEGATSYLQPASETTSAEILPIPPTDTE